MIEVISLASRALIGVSDRLRIHALGSDVLHLLLIGSPFLDDGLLLSLTEVTLLLPDDRRRGGVFRLLPSGPAVLLMEARNRPIQARRIDAVFCDHRGRDDLSGDRRPPAFFSCSQLKGGQVVLPVLSTVGIGHEN